MSNGPIDWDYEDRKEMERTCIREFVCESQFKALMQLLYNRERPDNIAFERMMRGDADEDY